MRNSYQLLLELDYHPTLLESSFWQKAANKYKKILYVLPGNMPENMSATYAPLCFFAAAHHIPINTGHFTRVDEKKLEAARKNLLQVIENGQFDPRALYVFQSAELWGKAVLRMTKGDWAGVVDGFDIVAPVWNSERKQDTSSLLRQVVPEFYFGVRHFSMASAEGTRSIGYARSQPGSD